MSQRKTEASPELRRYWNRSGQTRACLPAKARKVTDRSELRCINAQRYSQAWFAWADEGRAWFVVAEMAKVSGRHCQGRSIRMFFYDEDGRFVASGAWALQSEGSWILCER